MANSFLGMSGCRAKEAVWRWKRWKPGRSHHWRLLWAGDWFFNDLLVVTIGQGGKRRMLLANDLVCTLAIQGCVWHQSPPFLTQARPNELLLAKTEQSPWCEIFFHWEKVPRSWHSSQFTARWLPHFHTFTESVHSESVQNIHYRNKSIHNQGKRMRWLLPTWCFCVTFPWQAINSDPCVCCFSSFVEWLFS